MRSLDRLIEQVRKQTENEEFDQFTGISDQEFVQYLNDAQYNLQAAIVQQHPRVFIKETILTAQSGVEKYDLPSDCLLGNKVYNVEFSATGAEQDYYTLNQDTLKYRSQGTDGYPLKYIRLAGQILLSPVPQTGGNIRINYVRRLRELDKRQALTLEDTTVSSNQFTIKLDGEEFSTETDMLEKHDYICIVDKEGRSLVKNIEISSVSYDEIVCSAGHVLQPDESSLIPAGSYIVGGKDTTTHSELDISVERYLIAYCAWKILKRDSSVDSAEAIAELEMMLKEIVKSYAFISDDVQYIPDLNRWDDWSI